MAKLLVIGVTWPEPDTTAAGARMLQLLLFFKKINYKIYFASTAEKSIYSYNLADINIESIPIKLNDSDFDVFIKNLKPTIVLFDRFITEEQFGWRVAEFCPEAIRILDTEDLHFLRKTRLEAFKENKKITFNLISKNTTTLREIASIYRCDLSLIISTYEMKLLINDFKINKQLLLYLPFILKPITLKNIQKYPSFNERKQFMTIGNLNHEPNKIAIKYLKNTIWPLIKQKLPRAEIHIFGAYTPENIKQFHNKKEGFLIKGWIKNTEMAFTNARVCLVPLQIGAGLKGKLIDAMKFGTPTITTSIGAEGMKNSEKWNGFIADNPQDFANKAIELYLNETGWIEAQNNGVILFNKLFSEKKHEMRFRNKLENLQTNLIKLRTENFIGSMLYHHTLQSTKYLSKWIEEKEKNNLKL